MDIQLQEKLNAIDAKLSEIDETVAKIRKTQKMQANVRAAYWIFLILLGLGAFYFVQPFIDQLKDAYGFGGGNSNNSQNIDELIQQFKGEDY